MVKRRASEGATTEIDGVPSRIVSRFLQWTLVCHPSGKAPLPPKEDRLEMSFIRAYFWPLFLLIFTLATTVVIPVTVYHYGGSLGRLWAETTLELFVQQIPRPTCTAAAILFGWTLIQGLLQELVPGAKIYGPPTPAGERPEYVDNGIKCWIITHVGWVILGPMTNAIPCGQLYPNMGSVITTANLFAVPFCVFLYWKGRVYPSSRDAVWTGIFPFDFFQGVELHPRLLNLNVKQLLNCRVSMMGWSLSHLCFAQYQYENGVLSSGMIVHVSLLVLYLFKFFWWEAGYFASIDIIHDRCGYYIVWGVLCWVPTCYFSPGFTLVEQPMYWPASTAAIVFAVGILALWVNYTADYQRQVARATDGNCLIWGRRPDLIRAEYTTSEGVTRKSLLLVSGYWSISRHFNYIPELTLALMWSLPANIQLALPWAYWGFLFFLLIDRSSRDDEKCREKYGKYWDEYCRRVPYKIIPYVY
ncbi:membrane-associated protein, putative [Bodo saltans]|uniref:7-dehydrocholesterol reductase n=1 Tax=Bodo saltans TaxID=75058 RepID=A0A0S4KLN5_BODSA|nr:membrane-associated protein, putative [Bodo saltans]|eukprot:CUI15534.1 membrane-associated protein, putative [Bodo saltans]